VARVRTAASVLAPTGAWVALAHGALALGWAPATAYIGLTALAALGIGYEIGDGGTAAALFLLLAFAGTVTIAGAGAWTALLFAPLPALAVAPAAHLGGSVHERRSHAPITGKEVVEA
jgi:hypothetical protein